MASCIDIKAIERFVADNGIDAAPDLVKHLVFKWQSENNTDTEWPSAEYITEQLRGERFNPSEAQLKLFNTLKLNETKSFPTEEALNNYISNNLKSNGIYCFPQSSIYTYRGATGDYKLSLGLPTNAREKALIKQRAKEDGTFMKAPNGKPTNLTENQWLEVRTKAFKDWFGDWENDTENSSKVVDENGEPLVVYHHTDDSDLKEFSIDFDNYFTKDGGTKKAVFFDENKTGTLNRKYDIPVFLNIRDLRTYNGTKEDLHKAGTTYRAVVNESAEANDVTGGLHMHDFDDNKLEHQDIWIVHNPTQIKSATDNIGTYSNINERIDLQENKSDKDSQIDITELPDKIGPEELYSKLEALYDPNSSEGKLAKLIFDSLKSLPITFEKTDSLQGSFGQWVASAKTIMLNKNGIARNTLLHESIHALTSYYLNHPRRSELPQHIQIALKEIEHCYKLLVNDYLNNQLKLHIKTWKEMEQLVGKWVIDNATYGYASPTEMIAELSNPEFVKNIRRADNNYKGRNIFKRLVDAIFSLFKTNKEYTSIEKTLKEALVKLITTPSVELYEKYSQENANIKNNIKKLENEASIKFRYTKDQLRNLIFSKLEDVNSSIDNPYADIVLELEGNRGHGNTVANDFEVTPRVRGFLTNARPGTILISPAGVFTLLNGKVETSVEENKVTIPLRVLSDHFLAYNTFDIVKDERGIAYMTNIRPLEYKLPKKEQDKKETTLPTIEESSNLNINSISTNTAAFGVEIIEGSGKMKQAAPAWQQRNPNGIVAYRKYSDRPRTFTPATVNEGWIGNPFSVETRGADTVQQFYDWIITGRTSIDTKGRANEEFRQALIAKILATPENSPVLYYTELNRPSHATVIGYLINNKHLLRAQKEISLPQLSETTKRPTTQEDIQKAKSLLRSRITWTEGVIEHTKDKIKWNRATQEDIAELKEYEKKLQEDKALYNGLDTGYSEVVINEHNVPQIKKKEQTKPLSELVNHSGGAHGSDTYWGQIGEQYGVTSNHYYTGTRSAFNAPNGNVEISKEDYEEGRHKVAEAARYNFGYKYDTMKDPRLIRNWAQVKYADAIFAIGTLVSPGEKLFPNQKNDTRVATNAAVTGGTGYAVAMAILAGKPVYVFDQVKQQWYKNIGGKWSESEVPTLTKNFAGIGTREINDAGKKAIEEVYKKTAEQGLQQPVVPVKEVTTTPAETTIAEPAAPENTVINAALPTIEETKEEIAREDPLWENIAWQNVMKDPEFQYASMLADQGRVLTEQWGIPMSRIEEAAAEIGNYISDLITEVQRNPARAKALLGIELTQAEVERMTRPELITRISPNRLMAQVKKTKFDTSKFNDKQLENEDLVDETDAIFNNWEFVMSRAATIILENEKVQFKYNPKTKTTTAVEKNNEFTNPDDIEGQRLEDGIEETHENQQEWGIESKTLDLLNDVASPLVKDAFRQCYLTDAQGKIVQSERGINKRVRTRDAINQVFAWTVGVQSMNDAIQRLKAKSVKAQWLLPIIARLEDKSGKESDFQNQFWTVIRNSNVVYSVVKRTKQGMKAMDVSSNQVRREQVSSIKSLIQMGEHPLFGANGINLNNLGQFGIHLSALKDIKDKLADDIKEGKDIKNNPNYKKAVGSVGMLANLLGYYAPEALITENLNNESFNDVCTYLIKIGFNLERGKGDNKYDAFSYEEGSYGIGSYLNNLVGLLSASLQDTHITSIFDNGKMYQTRVKPSALLTQLAKFQLEDKEFKKFISDTYNLPWFRDTSEPDITKGWRLTFMQNLINNPEVRQNLQHQIQLNYNKKQYMKNMNPIEYTLATIAQFLAENPLGGKSTANKYAWFRIPIQSNKPTSEYLKMKCETDTFFRDTITDRMAEIFDQELSRIQTVTLMNAQKGDDKYIKNFSKRGKEFCFLDFMNVYLEGGSRANTELGKLIRAKIRGEEIDNEGNLLKLKKDAIKDHMQRRVNQMLDSWEQSGIAEAVKDFANIGKDVRHALEVFAWNDALASMNIMELFVHDIAFYDGADDLQKRLAELHAPGIRPNLDARDYQGKPVSDGIHRSIMLADAEGLTSNIIDNVSVVFDRRIQNAPEEQKGIWKDLREHLVGEKGLFRDINATDGQAYNCPASFRKKAIMFGKWDISKERLYQKIRSGKYTPEDVRKAFSDPTFGVLKPTTFGHSRMDTGVAPLNQISVPTYNKNSEYTLLMAEALLAGENTGRPNLLRAIFDVMQDSHEGPNGEWKTNGIDTIQFVSAVKSGEGKTVDIASLMEDADGEAKAKLILTQAIYNVDKADLTYDANGRVTVNPSRATNTASNSPTKLSYNKDVVRELPYDAFALQMDVANHFKEHEQIFGSQDRMIIPSELPEVNARGEEIMYNTPDGPKNAKEFRKAYEDKIAAQIADSVAQVEEELGLTNNSPIERKAAISKLLQREIMSNPRYGMDLYLAVSINPATKDFTIPLGDPVNSKRIESLLNAIIKDRVNKQMISGGPIVQVTSFGTSRRLGIKFKGRNGEILKTREEFNGTEEMYKRYLQDNQAGIAYMEVYASPYTNKLFEEFADANGVIDIKAIEAVNPELLKMIGYRIPTEAKYSISPLKIVGFLPRECGEGIMLPYEITLLNGSDFDVDKMYIMTKRFDINKKRFGLQKGDINKAVEYLKELPTMAELVSSEGEINTSVLRANKEAIMGSIFTKNDLVKELINSIRYRANVTEDEQQSIKEDIEREIQGKIYDYKRKHKTEEVPEEEIDKIRGEYNYEEAVETYRNAKTISRVKEFLEEDLYRPSATDGVLTSALRKAYLNFMYKVETPKDVKYQRDNDIIDMQWEVLTKEEVAYELLNPGGFDPQKRMGYIINAYKNKAINEEAKRPYTYEELCAIKNLKKLASLSAGSSNLMFFDTQVQYYKQNSAAGSLTGIFAVHRTAHAILEGDSLFVDVDTVGKLESQVDSHQGRLITLNPVTVLGMQFKGRMPIDVRLSRNGEYVGKQLGNSVASAVDAGKYPVLNLFNVNGITANVYTTLIKMGMPFEDVALFLGQKVISDLLDAYARASVTGYTSIYSLMEELLNALDKKHKFKTSKVEEEDLTREELIRGLLTRDDKTDYKTIRALRAFFGIANACRMPVAATRLNSVTSAVGPLVTDNIINAVKRANLNTESNIYDAEVGGNPITFEDIVNKHPILREFNKTYDIADKVFADMPTNSSTFRSIVNTIGASPLSRTFFNDSKLMSALSDFFQTYLAYANGVVKEEETLAYINDFPKAFAHRKYKERFKGNAFIDALQFETKEGSDKVALNVDTTGWDQSLKSPLSSAWLDLYNTNAEGRRLAISLVKYFIHKGGVGFTPKTAMNLVPTLLKEKVPNYNEAFKIKNIPSINTWELVDMFIRNNWDNYKLVPLRKIGDKEGEIRGTFTSEGVEITNLSDVESMKNTMYFRTKRGKEDVLLRLKEVIEAGEGIPVGLIYERVAPLGANGNYVEISTTKGSKEVTTTIAEQETSETPYGVNEDTSMEATDDVISNRASTANYLITFGDIDRLTTLLLSNNRDLSKAVEKKANTVETNSKDKALNAQLEEHFNTELERIGIQNEERVKLVQDIIDKINPC